MQVIVNFMTILSMVFGAISSYAVLYILIAYRNSTGHEAKAASEVLSANLCVAFITLSFLVARFFL